MGSAWDALVAHLHEVENLNMAGGLLSWDQQVLMPVGGAVPRASQLETVGRLSHEMFTSDKTARLLDAAEAEISGAAYDSDEASLIRVVREDYLEATKIPAELVGEQLRVTTLAHQVWADARAGNDFAAFAPVLSQILDITRRIADCRGYTEHPYDALIGAYERGITSAQVKAIFDDHKPGLVKLIHAIQQSKPVDNAMLHQAYDVEKQRAFALKMIERFGFDFQHGRQDVSVHPFANGFTKYDVRITTRFNPNFLNPALFGMFHEAGHGMYEQGVSDSVAALPLMGSGTSLGVHESQSRLWENIVGRSEGFWAWALPQLQEIFPEQVGRVDLQTFYRAINRVNPSYIRVEADEATYNLHIMLRFELEMEMIAGQVAVKDLPRVWNERFEAYLGIVPPTDTLGVLQDVHWSSGLIGYFATYALGNMLAAQYYRKALTDKPSIPAEIAQGKFDTLLGWLRTNIHQHGRKFNGDELTRRITGEGIQSKYYLEYLQAKYGKIYGV
ncbi:MAG: carboxypeptidase M32 [Anaerolineae bacterium]